MILEQVILHLLVLPFLLVLLPLPSFTSACSAQMRGVSPGAQAAKDSYWFRHLGESVLRVCVIRATWPHDGFQKRSKRVHDQLNKQLRIM